MSYVNILKTKSKYKNVYTMYNGIKYASKAEAMRAEVLDLAMLGGAVKGAISWWIGQPVFRLGVQENVYRADFLVVEKYSIHVEDVKGRETPKFKRDKKLWARYGPCDLWILKRKGKSGWHKEVIGGGNKWK